MKAIRYTWVVMTIVVMGLLASCSKRGTKQLLETIPQESLFVGFLNGEDIAKKANFEKHFSKELIEEKELTLAVDMAKSIKLQDLFFFVTAEKNLTFTFFVRDFKQFEAAILKMGYTANPEGEKEGYWMATNEEDGSTMVSNKKQVWMFVGNEGLAPLDAVKKYVTIKPEESANTIPHIGDIYAKDAGVYMNYALLNDLQQLYYGRTALHQYEAQEDVDWDEIDEELTEAPETDRDPSEVAAGQEIEEPMLAAATIGDQAIQEDTEGILKKAFPMLEEQKNIRLIASAAFDKKEIRGEMKFYDAEGKPYTSPLLNEVKITKELLANFPKDATMIAVSYIGGAAVDAICQSLDMLGDESPLYRLGKQVLRGIDGEIAGALVLPKSVMELSTPEYMILAQSKNTSNTLVQLDSLLSHIAEAKSQQSNGVYHLEKDLFDGEKGAYYGAVNNYVYYKNSPYVQPKESILENKQVASFVGSYGGFYLDLSSGSSLSTLVKQFTDYNLDGYFMTHVASPNEATIVFRNNVTEGNNILEGFVKLAAQQQ